MLASERATTRAISPSLRRIAATTPHLDAFSSVMEAEAMEASGARFAKGEARWLEGVPVTFKDFCDIAGRATETGFFALRKGPAKDDKPGVARLCRDGVADGGGFGAGGEGHGRSASP